MLNLAHMYADGQAELVRQIEDAIEARLAEERERIFAALEDIEVGRIFSVCRQEDLQHLIEKVADAVGADDKLVTDLRASFMEMKEMQDAVDIAISELID